MSKNIKNPILFISEDKDWISYINYSTSLYRPIKDQVLNFDHLIKSYSPIIDKLIELGKVTINTPSDMESIIHKLIIQSKSLDGDPSDNIKGFKGIGPKSKPSILINLNSVPTYYDYVGKTKAEKLLQSEIDRFINNTKVLGYEHIDGIDIMDSIS